jgi:O-antigen ligase/tetratricopeptide (TPR) repeat protein
MNKIIFFILCAAVFFIPLLFLQSMHEADLIKSLFLEAAAILIASLWILELILNGKRNFFINPLLIVLSFYILSAVISSVFASYFPYSLDGLREIFCLLIITLSVARLAGDEKRRLYLLNIFIAGGWFVGLIGIYQYISKSCGIDDYWGGQRFSSTLGNPNLLGAYFVPLISLSIFQIITNKKRRGFYILSIVLFLSLLLSAGSKGAIAGAVFSTILFLFLIMNRRFVSKKYLIVTAIVIAILLIGSFFIYKGELYDRNIKFRLMLWQSSLRMIGQNFVLGVGPNNFALSFSKYRDPNIDKLFDKVLMNKHAHNELLEVGAEQGIVGILAFSILICFIFREVLRLLISLKKENQILLIALLSGIAGILVHSFAGIVMRDCTSRFIFWVFIGFIMSFYTVKVKDTNKDERKLDNDKFDMAKTIIYSVLVVIFMGTGFTDIFRKMRSSLDFRYGQFWARNNLWEKAEEYYQKASELWPENVEYRYALVYVSANLKKYKKASGHYKIIKKAVPDYPLLDFRLAGFYYNRGEWNKALGYIEKSLAVYPYYNLNYVLGGKIYFELKKNESSDYFKKALDYGYKNDNIYPYIIANYSKRQNYDKAFLYYKKLWRDNSYLAEYFSNTDYQKAKDKMLDRLEEKYKSELNKIDNMHYLSFIYFIKKDYEKSQDLLEEILKINNSNFFAFVNLGEIYFKKLKKSDSLNEELFKKTLDCFKIAISINPNATFPYVRYGALLIREDRSKAKRILNKAVEKADRALKENEKFWRIPVFGLGERETRNLALYLLGCLYKEGFSDLDKAIDYFKQINPDSNMFIDAQKELIALYRIKKNQSGQLRVYFDLIRHGYRSKDIYMKLASIYKDRDDIEKAEYFYYKAEGKRQKPGDRSQKSDDGIIK